MALGNRLIMMHEGRIIFELGGEAKHPLSVGDLLAEFDKFRGSGGLSDRTLLG